jgi:hypothetical protein
MPRDHLRAEADAEHRQIGVEAAGDPVVFVAEKWVFLQRVGVEPSAIDDGPRVTLERRGSASPRNG